MKWVSAILALLLFAMGIKLISKSFDSAYYSPKLASTGMMIAFFIIGDAVLILFFYTLGVRLTYPE